VFLSTEAGGSGLNLQMADILINFELPWNPAKKNQRIGRIDRIGQKTKKLSIYNFITLNSIEMQISGGLLIKQSLFDGVLGSDSNQDFVDFSSKGRSQFIQQLEEFIAESENTDFETYEKTPETPELSNAEAKKEPHTELDILNEDDESLIEQDIEKTPIKDEELQSSSKADKEETKSQAKELEQVMNHGMQFLAGMFKMSTGKDMGIENQTIDVNEETGEVIMKFKLPL
jgi:superfamily II DNA/RNA helicase